MISDPKLGEKVRVMFSPEAIHETDIMTPRISLLGHIILFVVPNFCAISDPSSK
jgi:hypothetical protein